MQLVINLNNKVFFWSTTGFCFGSYIVYLVFLGFPLVQLNILYFLTLSLDSIPYFMVYLESLFSASKAAYKNDLCPSDGDPQDLIQGLLLLSINDLIFESYTSINEKKL